MISDRFRWVFCQLDTLRRCMPSTIRKALDELPITLDDTYERALQGIPKEKWQHAHRLFQCLVAGIRPFRVEELAEIFAIKFDGDRALNLLEGWRPEHPEEAVLSACSTLITIVDNNGSKIAQFSHFSVKEYLTSDRLKTAEIGNICNYHISLDAAHTILARACLTVLLQLDESVDKERLATFPLAFYAAQYWTDHAKFEDVALRIQDDIERLFNPCSPYLAAWVWIYDMDMEYVQRSTGPFGEQHPSLPNATALYYMSLCGFSELAKHTCMHVEDVNVKSGYFGTPLQAASYKGHIDVVRELLDHGANVNTTYKDNETSRFTYDKHPPRFIYDKQLPRFTYDKQPPLILAFLGRHLEIMRLLLERGADVNVSPGSRGLLLHYASDSGQVEAVHLLLRHNPDVNARGPMNWTPLHSASFYGHTKVVQLLLDHGADINALSSGHNTPLRSAVSDRCLEVVRLLLEHGADVNIPGQENLTPYQKAKSTRQTKVMQLLLEHGAKE